MSDRHAQSRKWLTINTGCFLAVAIYFVGFFAVNMFQSLTSSYSSFMLIATVASVLLFLWFGVRNFFGAWKAFSNLEYGKAMTKGITSWLAGIVLFVIDFIF